MNQIDFLQKDDGARVDTQEGMGEMIVEYFKKVIAKSTEMTTGIQVASPKVVSQNQMRN